MTTARIDHGIRLQQQNRRVGIVLVGVMLFLVTVAVVSIIVLN